MSGREIRIYEVTTDVNRFQYLLPESIDDLPLLFDGKPLTDRWLPAPMFSLKPTKPEPDFWDVGLGGHGTAWAIRRSIFDKAPALAHFLRPSGELLPLGAMDGTFSVFNITEVVDAIDQERTIWDHYEDGTVADIERPAFRADRLGEQLFKVPENSLSRIYCWEDPLNADEQFIGQVQLHELTGLTFDLVDVVTVPSGA